MTITASIEIACPPEVVRSKVIPITSQASLRPCTKANSTVPRLLLNTGLSHRLFQQHHTPGAAQARSKNHRRIFRHGQNERNYPRMSIFFTLGLKSPALDYFFPASIHPHLIPSLITPYPVSPHLLSFQSLSNKLIQSNNHAGQRAPSLQMGGQHPPPFWRRPQLPLHAQFKNGRRHDIYAGGVVLRCVGILDGRRICGALNGHGREDGEELGGI